MYNNIQIDNVKRVYSVTEIMGILSISKTAAYAFVENDPPFKVVKVGKSIRILKNSFDEWLNQGA
jgi:hypothetical protein